MHRPFVMLILDFSANLKRRLNLIQGHAATPHAVDVFGCDEPRLHGAGAGFGFEEVT